MEKYRQTREDRRHESEGMRRAMDRRDEYAGMIKEDHSEPANLPQDVIHRDYPKNRFMDRYELDDTARGIDDQRDEAVAKIEREHSDSKW